MLRPAPSFLILGAAGAASFVVAQLLQRFYLRGALDAREPAAAILLRLGMDDQLRSGLVLLTILALLPAYAALALATFRRRPAAALMGLLFGAGFVAAEVAYRSVDLLLVSRGWSAAFAAAGPELRATLLDRVAVWEGAVAAWYFPLLLAHGLSALAFAVAVSWGTPWDRALVVTLVANAIRALGRILQMHAGLTALAPVNGALYLPVTVATYGLVAAWLVRAARRPGSTVAGHARPLPPGGE